MNEALDRIYITGTGQVQVTEDGSIKSITKDREGISYISLLDKDTEITYEIGERSEKKIGKAGQILVVFYSRTFPNNMVLVDSKEWADNIIAERDREQKERETYATAAKLSPCDGCECGCPCCN